MTLTVTLTSTNELIFASFNHLAKIYLNKTLTNEEIISLFGPTEDVIIKNWCGSEYETGRKAYYDFYADNHEMADLYPGMEEVLALVKSKEIPCAIFTGEGERVNYNINGEAWYVEILRLYSNRRRCCKT